MQTTVDPGTEESLQSLPNVMGRFRLRDRPYLRHNIVLLVATIFTGTSNFLFHPVLERLLGVAAYGTVASFLALLTILLIPTPIIIAIVAKYASAWNATNQRGQLHDLVRRLTVLLLPLGIAVALVFVLMSNIIAGFFHLTSPQSLIILGLALTVGFASPLNLGAVQGLQRFGWYATLTAMPAVLRVVCAATLVALGFGVNGAVFGLGLSAIITYGVSFQPLQAILSERRVRVESLRSLWSYSLTTTIALACSTLLFNVDTVLAKHFLADHPAGYYAALATLGKTSFFVTGSVVAVMFPRVTALHAQGERTTRVAAQSLLGVFVLAGVAELIFIIASKHVLSILFGSEFTSVAAQLSWYGLAMLLLALGQVLIYYFLAINGRAFVSVLATCCGLLVALILAHHQSVEAIVQAVIVANGLLFLALGLLFFWQVSQDFRQNAAPVSTAER